MRYHASEHIPRARELGIVCLEREHTREGGCQLQHQPQHLYSAAIHVVAWQHRLPLSNSASTRAIP